MRIRPEVEDADVLAHVNRAYGVTPTGLTFIPKGDVGYAFRADTPNGPVFVKLHAAEAADEHALVYPLELARALVDGGHLDNVPVAIAATGGELVTSLPGWFVILQQWCDGEPLGERPFDETVALAVGRTAARLHSATDVLPQPSNIEARGLPNEYVEGAIAKLDAAADRGVTGETRALVLPRVGTLRASLAQMGRLQQSPAAAGPNVLVHSDLGHDNLIYDEATGKTWAVDWDSCKLAPREHDLGSLAWLQPQWFPAVAQEYRRVSGPVTLDGGELLFCAGRYVLYSIGFYIERLISRDTADDQSASDLSIMAWCFDELGLLEDRIKDAAAAVKSSL